MSCTTGWGRKGTALTLGVFALVIGACGGENGGVNDTGRGYAGQGPAQGTLSVASGQLRSSTRDCVPADDIYQLTFDETARQIARDVYCSRQFKRLVVDFRPAGSCSMADGSAGFVGAEILCAEPSPTPFCDFNVDGIVDTDDLTILQQNRDAGLGLRRFSEGDCDLDGDVDEIDVDHLMLNLEGRGA